MLADPEARSTYDQKAQIQQAEPLPIFEMKEFIIGIDAEVNRRLGALCLLYTRRQNNPDSPGLSLLDLESRMALPREHLEFTIWYLRDKHYVRRDDTSNDILITGEGVDYVEANLPVNRIVRKLLKAPELQREKAAAEE